MCGMCPAEEDVSLCDAVKSNSCGFVFGLGMAVRRGVRLVEMPDAASCQHMAWHATVILCCAEVRAPCPAVRLRLNRFLLNRRLKFYKSFPHAQRINASRVFQIGCALKFVSRAPPEKGTC